MDVSVGNSPKAQMPHASRSKYLEKILGTDRVKLSQMQRFVTLSPVCPQVLQSKWWKHLGSVLRARPTSLSEQMGSRAAGGPCKWSDQILLGVWTLDWHSIQKNYRERLKIGKDGGASLASRATSVGARMFWRKKLLLSHLGWEGGLTWCFLLCKLRLCKVRLLRGIGAPQRLLFWPRLWNAALHTWAKRSVISGLACFFCLTSSKWRNPASSPELSDHKSVGFSLGTMDSTVAFF